MTLQQRQDNILHLNLKRKWWEMIASGKKTEEYREIKPYWQRVFSANIKIKGKYFHPSDVIICFSLGYSKNRSKVWIKCESLTQSKGIAEWGAEPNEIYYVLKLGDIIRWEF